MLTLTCESPVLTLFPPGTGSSTPDGLLHHLLVDHPFFLLSRETKGEAKRSEEFPEIRIRAGSVAKQRDSDLDLECI